MPDHNYFANLIWQIADLLRGPYRPPQYERVMLPEGIQREHDKLGFAGRFGAGLPRVNDGSFTPVSPSNGRCACATR
jgi:hypothetical protein